MRELPFYRNRVVWAVSYLRGEAEARFRPYVEDKLMNGVKCRIETTEIFAYTDNYFAFLFISYRDLNEVRTAELKINRLRQKDSFPEYLARFTRYASQIV
jgi:Retrotransposon gag protein